MNGTCVRAFEYIRNMYVYAHVSYIPSFILAAFSNFSAKYMLTCMKFIVYDILLVNLRLDA